MLNIFQPDIGNEEIKEIDKTFKTNWTGKGKKVDELELNLSQHFEIEVNRVVTTNSCTEALFTVFEFIKEEIAEIKSKNEVILTPINFIGAANAIIKSGLKPVIVDINDSAFNISKVEDKINANTAAILITPYGGNPQVNVDNLFYFCRQKDILLISDNAISISTQYKGKNIAHYSDFSLYSFDSMKHVAIGDGGAIITPNNSTVDKIRKRLYMGLTSKSGLSSKKEEEWWEFDITKPSRRSIMNDITASIGIIQLKNLESKILRRKEIYEIYENNLKEMDEFKICVHEYSKKSKSSYYFFWIQFSSREKRNLVSKWLKSKDIFCTFRYFPITLVDGLKKYLNIRFDIKNSHEYAHKTLCLPLHSSLKNDEVEYIISTLKSLVESEEFKKLK